MSPPKLTKAVARQTLKAIKDAEGVRVTAAATLGISSSTLRQRIPVIEALYPDLPKVERGTGARPTVEKTLEEDIAIKRAYEGQQSARAKLKDAAARIVELEDRLKELEWASRATFSPAEWSLPDRAPKKREHMPYLLTSDFQIGEVIRAEETETGYGYDSEIFRKRYRRMIDTTIYLSTEHAGALWKYPGIIYARGGDTISGGIHEELRETDDMTPMEAVECAFEEESAGIEHLAEAFGKVEVKTPGAAGNHDRNTVKPQTKKASAHSYDRLISFMLANHFKRDQRVTFQTSRSFDVRFPIYDMHILLTHGDRMGSSGGQGFIGPLATIMRGAQKVIMEQAALGFPVDRVDHGHFHTPGYMGWVLSNGCMPGYSEYAKSYRMRPSPPQQMLAYHHPRRGLVDLKPIILTEA